MMSRRDKVAEAIRQEVSLICQNKLNDPRVGFVTITGVELTEDLRYAKIHFSVLGDDEAYKKTKMALNSALGFIRTLVAERINLKFAPEIGFYEDRSSEYSVKIQKVLDEISELSGPKDPEPKEKAIKKRKENKVEPKKSRRVHKKE